jgi:hypothetical protein
MLCRCRLRNYSQSLRGDDNDLPYLLPEIKLFQRDIPDPQEGMEDFLAR